MVNGEAPAAPELSVVIPVFNGARTIAALVEALSALEVPGGLEIILVNDGSADDSAEVCAGLVAAARVPLCFVDLARNFGEHNAVLAGLREARGRYVVTMDDDMQDSPAEVPRLLDHAKEGDFDAVYTHSTKKAHSAWRNLGSRLANLTANLVLDKPKDLYLSSFRCLGRVVVDQISGYDGPYPYVDGLVFAVTDRVGSLEVDHRPRSDGRSNYTLARLFALWTNILLNFSTLPLRLSVWLGLVMALLSGLGVVYVLIDYFTTGRVVPGWASVMIVLLVFAGLQFVVIGLIGEYLGRVYISSGRRPQSVVRRVVSSERPAPPSGGTGEAQ